jgi:hypothetical protein
MLFLWGPPNTCDGKMSGYHFPLHQPCFLTQQHTLYLRAKFNKTTIMSIVATTQYWNKKQWDTNLIIGTTHLNTHITTKTQFQTFCFNFLKLTTGLCFACTYLFILIGISSSLSTKRIMGTMDCYHNNNSYYNYYFERKLDWYPQHCYSDKRFNFNNKCKRFNYNKKCRQGAGK